MQGRAVSREAPVWAAGQTGAHFDRYAGPQPAPTRATRASLRPRAGFIVALFFFFALQAANAAVTWREAPIRTESMSDAVVAYLACAAVVIPAFVIRGRWRAVPLVLATVAGAFVPVALSRDLMDVVGPRNVWVGQSLTLQVLFPLVIGALATVAVLSAPRISKRCEQRDQEQT